jgi:hypothetical protein
MIFASDSPDAPDRADDADDWTPARGLLRGTVWTSLAGGVLGTMLCVVTYYAPPLTLHRVLNFVCGFLATGLLFSVMHRAAGMVSLPGTAVVVLWAVLIFEARYVTVLTLADVPISSAALFDPAGIFRVNLMAWGGMAVAVFMCRDGDSAFEDIVDRVMVNPLTGRRD